MTEEKFEKVKELINKRFDLNTDKEMEDFSRTSIQFHQLVLDLMVKETLELKQLQLKKDELFSKKFKYYNEEYNKKRLTPKDIATYINADEEYYQLSYEYQRVKTIADYLERTIDNIKRSSFQVKNYIELKKFLNGVY